MGKKSKTIREGTPSARTTGKTNSNAGQPSRFIIRDEESYERVARKAYELYQQRGEMHGHDLEDWLAAERLVQKDLRHGPLREEPLMEE